MTRRRLVGLIAGTVALVIALLVWRSQASRVDPSDHVPTGPRQGLAVTKPLAHPNVDHVAPVGASYDDDPIGELRLEGQVVDDREQPIAGASVVIDAHPPRETITETDGSFAFDGLVPRTYRVEAHAAALLAGPVAMRLTATSPPIVLRMRRAARIVVTVRGLDETPLAGALVELRALGVRTMLTSGDGTAVLDGVGGGWHVLKVSASGYASTLQEVAVVDDPGRETAVTVRLRDGVALAGTVIDPNGAPVEGASVVAEPVSRYESLAAPHLDAVVTDAKGRWRITGVARESMRVGARHAGFAPTVTAPISLEDGASREDIVIALERGARITGRVVDSAGAAVPGAEVRVMGEGGAAAVRRVTCDAGGGFSLEGLPRRRIYLAAFAEQASSGPTSIGLDGGDRDGVVLRLERVATLGGTVVTRSGEPVPEARVVIEPTLGPSPLGRVDGRLVGELGTIADLDGRFSIPGIAPGSYHVRAIRAGEPRAQLGMKAGVIVEAGRTDARIEVDELGRIVGTIEIAGGRSLTPYWVRLGREAPKWFDTPTFEIDDVPAGQHFIEIDGPDVLGVQLPELEVTAGKALDLGTIKLTGGRTLRGTVVDGAGAPVAGATVVAGRQLEADGLSLAPYPSPRLDIVVSDRDGHFTVAGLGTGETTVVADHERRGRSIAVAVPPGTADVEATLTLKTPGVVRGFIRVRGAPTDADVMLHTADAPNGRLVVPTGPDGGYRFDRVAPGRYMLYASLRHGTNASGSNGSGRAIVVEPGRVVDADLELGSDGVAVTLHLGAPATIEFGYGLMAAMQAPLTALPRTVTEARRMLTSSGGGEVREGMIAAGRQIELTAVRPGHQIACVSPLRGNPSEPSVLAELQSSTTDWPVNCINVNLGATPAKQDVTVDVPSLPPKR